MTPKSDVYSLGATLYQAAAGEPPFTGTPDRGRQPARLQTPAAAQAARGRPRRRGRDGGPDPGLPRQGRRRPPERRGGPEALRSNAPTAAPRRGPRSNPRQPAPAGGQTPPASANRNANAPPRRSSLRRAGRRDGAGGRGVLAALAVVAVLGVIGALTLPGLLGGGGTAQQDDPSTEQANAGGSNRERRQREPGLREAARNTPSRPPRRPRTRRRRPRPQGNGGQSRTDHRQDGQQTQGGLTAEAAEETVTGRVRVGRIRGVRDSSIFSSEDYQASTAGSPGELGSNLRRA